MKLMCFLVAATVVTTGGILFADGKKMQNALDVTMKDIDGKPVELAKKYQGKVVLLVNVASFCGYTTQYKELEAVHEKYNDKGLRVVGVPANNFKNQEPGTNDEIKQFCSTKGVKFDLLAKVSVKGDDISPLYKYLTSKETNPNHGGEIKWNFEKFVISKDGKVVAHYRSATKPDDPELIKVIEAELAK